MSDLDKPKEDMVNEMLDRKILIKTQAKEIEKLRAAPQSARRDALEEAAQIAAHYERMAYQRGDLPLGDPNECAAQVAREIEAAVRALGEKE